MLDVRPRVYVTNDGFMLHDWQWRSRRKNVHRSQSHVGHTQRMNRRRIRPNWTELHLCLVTNAPSYGMKDLIVVASPFIRQPV